MNLVRKINLFKMCFISLWLISCAGKKNTERGDVYLEILKTGAIQLEKVFTPYLHEDADLKDVKAFFATATTINEATWRVDSEYMVPYKGGKSILGLTAFFNFKADDKFILFIGGEKGLVAEILNAIGKTTGFRPISEPEIKEFIYKKG